MIERRFTIREEEAAYVKVTPGDFVTAIDVENMRKPGSGAQNMNATYKITCEAIRELARYEDTGFTPSEVLAMAEDMQEIKSCAVCANRDKCDPSGNEKERRFFCECVHYDEGGALKHKWEWRGLAAR